MTRTKDAKTNLKSIIDSIVNKMESEYEVFYLNTDSITESVYCLILGGKINTVEEMKLAINKMLKNKLVVVE